MLSASEHTLESYVTGKPCGGNCTENGVNVPLSPALKGCFCMILGPVPRRSAESLREREQVAAALGSVDSV